MTERAGPAKRPRGMWMRVPATLLVLPLLLSACGDNGAGPSRSPQASHTRVLCSGGEPPVSLTEADLDGDGTLDEVVFTPPAGTCPGTLGSPVEGLRAAPTLDWDASPAASGAAAVRVPGRTGDLVLLLEEHPRGGFQAHLFGYADGELEELLVDGKPVFGFIATDVLTDPTAAHCVSGGFEVVQARAHEPIGVVPAWDVFRTTYAVDGNAVSAGPTTEVADNVLDEELHRKYSDLVDYSLFEDCRVR